MFPLTEKQIARALDKFVWDFKVGDNIVYNFRILFSLYRAKEKASVQSALFIKPLLIIIVAIAEAIFFDLMGRLDIATSHFPRSLQANRLQIKADIDKNKVTIKKGSKDKRIKNYKMKHYEEFFLRYQILGKPDHPIYADMKYASKIRNRIHIQNYYGDMHRDEELLFTEDHLKKTEGMLVHVMKVMTLSYPRPFGGDNDEHWLQQLQTVSQ
jgi:hypothetical protein